MKFSEKIIEGKYRYILDGNTYCHEEFTVHQEDKHNGDLQFQSNIRSHLDNGEILSIDVTYALTHRFEPLHVKIKRTLGAKQSAETYTINLSTKNIDYQFKSESDNFTDTKNMSGKPQFITPSFATSMIMLNSKITTSIKNVQYTLIHTDNIWSYESQMEEKTVFARSMSLEPISLKVGANNLKCSHYAFKLANSDNEDNFYLSKHYYIPYKAVFNNGLTIEVEGLKTFESPYNKVF